MITEYSSVQFTRRQALFAGGLGTIGLSLPQLLHAENRTRARTEKSIILVVPWGGPSQHDSLDPKPDAPEEVRSLYGDIATRTVGMRLGSNLPRLAAMSDLFSVLRAVSHDIGAHNPATHLAFTGYRPRIANENTRAAREDFPAIGSALAKVCHSDADLPSYVQLPMPMIDNGNYSNGQNAGFLGAGYDPLVVAPDHSSGSFSVVGATPPSDVGPDRSADRRDLLRQLDSYATRMAHAPNVRDMNICYTRAYDLFRSAASSQAFDISREPMRVRDRYGPGIGQSVLAARRLVEAGVRLVLVADTSENTNSKWDTHGDDGRKIPLHLRESDQAVSALFEDLHLRGLLDTTIVAWMAEFGRTPRLKPGGGRDHWPAVYSVLVGGGGIRGGRAIGASDSLGAQPRDGRVRPEDILATFYSLLGLPLHTEIHDPTGRPHRLCQGNVIQALL